MIRFGLPSCPIALAIIVGMLTGCQPAQNGDLPKATPPVDHSQSISNPRPAGGLLADLAPPPEQKIVAPLQCGIRFADVHEEAGVSFTYDNGFSEQKLMPHSTSGGAAWLDFDCDGHWDLFCGQGGRLDVDDWSDQPKDQLFRQYPGARFEVVTAMSLPRDGGFGHGVAAGDFNNDGFDDVFVACVGEDVLLQNMGDGTFLDVTAQAGVGDRLWSSSAAWGDVDRDGDLDLHVSTYLDYDCRHPIECRDEGGKLTTCNPTSVQGVPDLFYLNQGDGTFRESAEERGLVAPGSKSLGSVIADLNGDDLPDIYVANDTEANHCFLNEGDGRFVESALTLGCALSGLGQAQASMGIAFGDYDENGWPDLYLTHFTDDSNTLYQNLGLSGFVDVTRAVELHGPTLPYLAFGTVMADFDSNGRQDLFVANGHIDDWRSRTGALWKMPPQMFTFDGDRWHECTNQCGPYFQMEWLGRGVASADYDDDGDLDLAVIHQNDPMALLRNDSESGHWLQARMIGVHSNRRGVGAKVKVRQGDRELVQELAGGTSYAVSHQPLLSFGLGPSDSTCDVTVTWPSGRRQELKGVAVNQRLILREDKADQGME